MSQPLSSAHQLKMRKELVRLRMEMHRQQMHYHAQPLTHPLNQIKSMWNRPSGRLGGKTPLAMGGALLLTLFGKRLGVVGRLARIGLAVYPLVSAWRKSQEELRPPTTTHTTTLRPTEPPLPRP